MDTSYTTAQYASYMQLALAEARAATRAGEVPVGAIVIKDREVVGRGHNRVIGACDPTAHAEVAALRDAATYTGNYRLSGCDLVVTLEPCVMCAGALVQARIRRLIFGAADEKGGAVVSNGRVLEAPGLHHRVEVTHGILEEVCGELLREFFRNRRGR